MKVRAIIEEALHRVNLVPKKQPAGGMFLDAGFRMLKGLVSRYNNDNYLAFTQNSLDLPPRRDIHIYEDVDSMAGENNRYFDTTAILIDPENYPTAEDYDASVWAMARSDTSVVYSVINPGPGVYRWLRHPNPDEFSPRYQQMKRYAEAYHVQVPEVAKLNTLMVVINGTTDSCYKLDFLPREEFDRFVRNDPLWTWVPLAEGEWFISVKPYVSNTANRLRLNYNRALRFEMDTDLRVPDAYNELLITALSYSLALEYPRLDESHMQRLKDELGTMLSNVATPKADAKQVLRDDTEVDDFTYYGVVSGRFLL